MNTLEMVRAILKQTPGDALCDACLAFSCATTLSEMRRITASLRDGQTFAEGSTACDSCRRITPTTVWATATKCAHCSRLLGDDGLAIVLGGDHFHRACWQRLLSDERIRISHKLSLDSQRLIARARAMLGRPRPPVS